MSLPPTPPRRYDATPPASPPASPPPQHHFQPSARPLRPRLRSKPSLLDELLPTPAGDPAFDSSTSHVLRRAGSVAVISIFLLSIIYLASSDPPSLRHGGSDLRQIFGVGSKAGVGGAWSGESLEAVESSVQAASTSAATAADTTQSVQSKQPDFEQYKMLRTVPDSSIKLDSVGHRAIFIGDVHGSYDPLIRLMDKISYNPSNDRLIHVGDLIAKGSKNEEVLWWMNEHRILGVRGNHDQPVLQWRAWMEWAGGADWEAYIDSIADGDSDDAIKALTKAGKAYPESWQWKGEHWKIARALPKRLYLYLLELPLVLHIPSIHAFVVHAGLLPSNPLKSSNDASQPLIQYANVTTSQPSLASRNSEELSILYDVPQNQIPWNLINIRSVRDKGKHRGQVTDSAKKGEPWSDLWKREMKRCTGEGHWAVEGMGEWTAEHQQSEDAELESQEDGEVDETKGRRKRSRSSENSETDGLSDLNCSPVTVIYGHAAGRGLDIKPFSKGLDSGCVYGRKLTALILGDIQGLVGEVVRVGNHQGLIIQEDCGNGGT